MSLKDKLWKLANLMQELDIEIHVEVNGNLSIYDDEECFETDHTVLNEDVIADQLEKLDEDSTPAN